MAVEGDTPQACIPRSVRAASPLTLKIRPFLTPSVTFQELTLEYKFDWKSTTDCETRKSTEANIRAELKGGHYPIAFCHEGTIVVTLLLSGPLQTKLVGNMKCSCGKAEGEIESSSDGSGLILNAVGK